MLYKKLPADYCRGFLLLMMILKMMMKNNFLGILLVILLLTVSCGKNGSPADEPVSNGFDKTAMLTDYADNLIIPAYTDLQQKLQVLSTGLNTFISTPNLNNQQALLLQFKTAYLSFEHVSFSQFGPAENLLYNNFMNTLPATTNDNSDHLKIEASISSGIYNLSQTSTVNQQGFPALDYLLFSTDAVQQFTAANSANRKKYTQDLLARMQDLTTSVINSWKSNYRAQFIANTRSDAGSPIGYMVNQFAYEMDQLKGPRIGWPFGKQSGGIVFEQKCEGYYAKISLALAIENLSSLKAYYKGSASGKGLSSYLTSLGKEPLNQSILSYFDTAINQLKAIPDPLAASLTNNKAAVDSAYKEIQNLLTALKTDLASALSVRITYVDNDGD